MTWKKIPVLLVSLMIFTAACAAKPVIIEPSGSESESVTIKKGDKFTIRLDSRLSTGYSWKALSIPDRITLLDEKVKTAGGQITGAEDIQEFIFSANEPGKYSIIFKYGEHWKKNPEYIKTFRAEIEVK